MQAEYNKNVIQLAFLVACLYTAIGVLRLGFLIRFLSHAVITGFTSGAALVIAAGQVKYLLGVSYKKQDTLQVRAAVFPVVLSLVHSTSGRGNTAAEAGHARMWCGCCAVVASHAGPAVKFAFLALRWSLQPAGEVPAWGELREAGHAAGGCPVVLSNVHSAIVKPFEFGTKAEAGHAGMWCGGRAVVASKQYWVYFHRSGAALAWRPARSSTCSASATRSRTRCRWVQPCVSSVVLGVVHPASACIAVLSCGCSMTHGHNLCACLSRRACLSAGCIQQVI
jgi:hypothetical protein